MAVYPHGGPWDGSGPNSAVLVGQIWTLRRPNHDTRDRIDTQLRSWGIRVTGE
ncbi:hypothetical protein QLR68_14515 [Micromonospora sp. DH15]|nr:hypothetical protein [Micromonospora sp. DH15]